MRPKNLTGGTDDPAFDPFRYEDLVGYPTTYHKPNDWNPLAVVPIDRTYDGPAPEGSLSDNFVTRGTKWGTSGALGTAGGTVTWSIAGAGLSNASSTPSWFSGLTVDLGFLGFDYMAILNQAFAAWSAVANISFVQVADAGGNMGTGMNAMIRISAGLMDGRPPPAAASSLRRSIRSSQATRKITLFPAISISTAAKDHSGRRAVSWPWPPTKSATRSA